RPHGPRPAPRVRRQRVRAEASVVCEAWRTRPDAARPRHREPFTAEEPARALAYRRHAHRRPIHGRPRVSRLVRLLAGPGHAAALAIAGVAAPPRRPSTTRPAAHRPAAVTGPHRYGSAPPAPPADEEGDPHGPAEDHERGGRADDHADQRARLVVAGRPLDQGEHGQREHQRDDEVDGGEAVQGGAEEDPAAGLRRRADGRGRGAPVVGVAEPGAAGRPALGREPFGERVPADRRDDLAAVLPALRVLLAAGADEPAEPVDALHLPALLAEFVEPLL